MKGDEKHWLPDRGSGGFSRRWPEGRGFVRSGVQPGFLIRPCVSFRHQMQGLFAVWLIFAMTLPAARAADSSGDRISFFDGASLRGELLSIDPKQGVTWRHPEAKEPIVFQSRNVHEIRFDPMQAQAQAADVRATCFARLNNGDEIQGELLSLDGATAAFRTWFAGDVKARRESVRSLTFVSDGLESVYRGPTGMQGWNVGRNVSGLWRYADGAFTTTNVSFLGRAMQLPERTRVVFDLEWNGPLSLMFALHTDMVNQFSYGASGYSFAIGSGWVSLQRAKSDQGRPGISMSRSFLGQARVASLAIKQKARFEIRADAEESTLHLLVDGEPAHTWKDPNGFLPPGQGITFYAQRNGTMVRLSNLIVAEWGGEPDAEGPGDGAIEEPLVLLANKDRFGGDVRSIREGKLGVATDKIELNIPLNRVRQVYLKSPALDLSRHSPDEVRAVFSDLGQVTVKLDRWSPEELRGRHQDAGPMTLKPSWVRALQFNLQRGRPAAGAANVEVDPHWPKDERKGAGQ